MSFHLRPVLQKHLTRAFSTTTPSRNPTVAKITIIGRLAAQPEVVATASGRDMVRYTLATDYGPRDNKQTSWWKVFSFVPEGGQRDFALGLGKGSLLYVEGEASMQRYQREGVTQTGLNIVQRQMDVLQKRDVIVENEGQDDGAAEN